MTDMREKQLCDVVELLDSSINLLRKKGNDYSHGDLFSNFRFTGMVLDEAINAGLRGGDLAFVALIATKLGRIFTLIGGECVPNNESVVDTHKDMQNYIALWGVYHSNMSLLSDKYTENNGENICD